MRKHAPGFVFFAAIIAVFVVGYAAVVRLSIPDIPAVEIPDEPLPISEKVGQSVRITQAIADPVKETLALSLADGGRNVTEIDLAIYGVLPDGISFVRGEVVKLQPWQWTADRTSTMIRYPADCLGNGQITDNLYVIAAARDPLRRTYEPVPFSREKATAVLLAKN